MKKQAKQDPYQPTHLHSNLVSEMILLFGPEGMKFDDPIDPAHHDAIVRAMMKDLCAWRAFDQSEVARTKRQQEQLRDLLAAVRWLAGAVGQGQTSHMVGSSGPTLGLSAALTKIAADIDSACHYQVQYPRWREINPAPPDSVREKLERIAKP